MNERPILAGQKTQTRCVVKPQPSESLDGFRGVAHHVKGALWRSGLPEISLCPYGAPGDRLWVRETFALQSDVDGDPPPFVDGRPVKRFDSEDESGWVQPHYRATDPAPELSCPEDERHNCGGDDICVHPWRPSIFMPRWASRITLELTRVRVERVQDISEADALAEGCQPHVVTKQDVDDFAISDANPVVKALSKALGPGQFTARFEYERLWNSINAKRGFGWGANPWVWVIEFRRIATEARA